MLSILCFLFNLLFSIFRSKKSLLVENSLYKKEIEILKRQKKNHLRFNHSDRIVFSILNNTAHLKDTISIVQPETILRWQRQLIKRFWTFKHLKRGGRPPVDNEIKQLILSMKNDNLYWGYKKIQGERLKLGVKLDTKTIRNIIAIYRRKGKLKKSLTWKRFLTLQAKSIYAMDFFTIDTILNQRFYVYFIIHHQSRQIVHFAMTQTPCVQFVKQQLIQFENTLESMVYMIHDNAAQFKVAYLDYGVIGVRTSVKAPNMNSIAERFVGTIRREALDYFLLLGEKQIISILKKYIDYYNSKRPHQGLRQMVPCGYQSQYRGRIQKKPILGGLCFHYKRCLS